MKKQITVYQHFVPKHYLRLWKNSGNSVWWHDLQAGDNKPRATTRILGADYLYEEDVASPNNEIEDFLSTIENDAAPILQKISGLQPDTVASVANLDETMCGRAALLLSAPGAKQKLLNFISAQLVRTVRTVEDIELSIQESDHPEDVKAALRETNKPYLLVQLGMQRLPFRLTNDYTIVLSYVEGSQFVTSDHPVAEVCAYSKELPQTVYNVLHKADTFLSFPLGPSFHCFLVPKDDSNRNIKLFRNTLMTWQGNSGIDDSIQWRKLQPELIISLRTLQTMFGRKFLISCRDETNFI